MKRVTLPKPGGDGDDAGRTLDRQSEQRPSEQASRKALEGPENEGPARPRHFLPPELMEIIVPSLKVGAATGTVGLFTGAVAGIVRSAPTLLFSIASGGQLFVLGSSYYASRLTALKVFRGDEEILPADKLKASTFAGGFAGLCGGLLRGPRNIIPGAIMFSLFGAGGQFVANKLDRRPRTDSGPNQGFLHSKWSPVTFLSDQEYEKILEEKLLRVETEIALVDDHIKALRDTENGESRLRQPSGGEQ